MLQLKNGRSLHIWITLGCILAYEAAMHMIAGCKGSSGLRNCLLCSNLFNHLLVEDMEVLSRIGGVTHTCTDSSQLQLHDESTLRAIQECLLTARASMHVAAQLAGGSFGGTTLDAMCSATGRRGCADAQCTKNRYFRRRRRGTLRRAWT